MTTVSNTHRYRWMVASRVLAAVVGGYALTSAATVLIALILPLPKAQAVMASSMLSFALYAAILVWVFSAKRVLGIWLGLIMATALCAGLSWLLLIQATPGGAA